MFGIMTRKPTNQQNCYKDCSVVMRGTVNNQKKKKFTTFCLCVHVLILGGFCYPTKILKMPTSTVFYL